VGHLGVGRLCYTPFVNLPAVPESVRSAVSADVAREIAMAYTDQVIFPDMVVIDLPEASNRRFPGWVGPVLVISVENQGVCAWGVPPGFENPAASAFLKDRCFKPKRPNSMGRCSASCGDSTRSGHPRRAGLATRSIVSKDEA
jgi:hypothetical protein